MKYFYNSLEDFEADANKFNISIVKGPEGKYKRWLSALVLDHGSFKAILIMR